MEKNIQNHYKGKLSSTKHYSIMKRLFYIFIGTFIMSSLLLFSACKNDDGGDGGDGDGDPTVEEQALEKLAGTWALNTDEENPVQQNQIEPYSDWSNFTITFTTNQTYSVTGGNPPLPDASGEPFTFNLIGGGTAVEGITLSTDQQLNFETLTDSNLIFTFSYSETSGKTLDDGSYRFSLVKQ